MEWDQLSIFIFFFAVVTVLGFVATRWHKADLSELNEWGLAGRRFGTVITWFLLGGDLYTAYTFIAIPALVFGAGAIGLFAIPYTIIVYPIVFVVMPKLWTLAHRNGYVTGSDYVKDRFESRFLALLIAITGIVATMPYIALQMFGIEVVLTQMGLPVETSLLIAFVVLAVYTYVSGLRAPALIALVKDTLIWITVIVAVIYIPFKLGGYGRVFSDVPKDLLVIPPELYPAYATLALGSALALFLYPHAITGVFSSSSGKVVERNAALLPAYSFLLGLIALLGYMAVAAGIKGNGPLGANAAVPTLIESVFPGWFSGFAFAAIAIGALVPASVMSIAAANLFGRNIWQEYIKRGSMTPREETRVAQIASLVVKVGALVFILGVPTDFVINFQLAGGVWILQTLPALMLALYIPWLHRTAVIAGWFAGIVYGTYELANVKFAESVSPSFLSDSPIYIALSAFVLNLIVVLIVSAGLKLFGAKSAAEQRPEDLQTKAV
jgi:solute:Na+ symporter, SSS family